MDSKKLTKKLRIIHPQDYQDFFKPRLKDTHKGDFGHVLVIGGDYGYAGAVILAAKAALRIGSGLVSVATRPEHVTAILCHQAEIMAKGISNIRELKIMMERATVLVLGPGLGQSAWSKKLFQFALKSPLPKIIDADGLNLLAQSPQASENWILTPHPAEAGRLLKQSSKEIQHNRLEAIQKLQQQYGGIMILKGHGTLVKGPSEKIFQCVSGNPGMATGGTGDVLSGIIGGLVAQKMPLLEAACAGVDIHGRAGDLVKAEYGEHALVASDIIHSLHHVL